MDSPVLDHVERGVLGHCVEDYCGSSELLWAVQRLTPGLSNRAVLVRRGLDVLERLLTEHLIAAYVKSSDPATPFAPVSDGIDELLAVVEREHVVSPETPHEQRYWFTATPAGVTRYFDAQQQAS
ncbi:MAG TPA: hypothetical protein VFN94_08050 [Nitrospiria bacterium]|nr:hypothetical protein [Nitrospiria bacterium]